jgi:hypothetical protein
MRYMQTIPRQRSNAAASADELATMRPEIQEIRGTERVDSRSSRARGALGIGLLTALVSLGLGGRYLAAEPEPEREASGPEASYQVPPAIELDAVAATLDTPVEDDVIRGNVVSVQAQVSPEVVEVWVVGRLGRLVLGEVRATARDGVIAADLPVVTPPDVPVTALDLVIETRDGGQVTILAARRVAVAPRSPVTLESVSLEASGGALGLNLVGTAPVGMVVEVSVKPSFGSEAVDVAEQGAVLASFEDTGLPFGLGRWVCSVPLTSLPSELTIDVRWASSTGQAGSILITRLGSDLDVGREGS